MTSSIKHEEPISFLDEGGWQKAWEMGITPWDRKKVQPGLIEVFEEIDFSKFKDGKVLVAGCGRGYDVVFLSTQVGECYGWDISPKAVSLAQEWLKTQSETNAEKIHFEVKDFFHSESSKMVFDLAYDYTFLCAILPSKRQEWSRRYSELIKKGGKLITLIYPIDGDRPGGPPFSLDPDEVTELLTNVGFKRIHYKIPTLTDHPQRELMAIWERL
ncbi:S-adenosyl-L-methionine-dependent methyltransferase [Melampsora americana]|nr:S-adenosyl-L-methionine-dependent methyltransferase [Melampsora americana]